MDEAMLTGAILFAAGALSYALTSIVFVRLGWTSATAEEAEIARQRKLDDLERAIALNERMVELERQRLTIERERAN